MLNEFLINIMEVNSVIDGSEIKIYNKEEVSKFGIKTESVIVSGESKTYIPEIVKTFGITSIKLLKQLLSNKDIKENGTFELIKEVNSFTNQEELSTLKISSNEMVAQIRLASEDVLQKIPIAKNIEYNINCKDIDSKTLTKLSKSVELLENNDEHFTIEVADQNLYFKSGKAGQNLLQITCPFLCNHLNYQNLNKYRCKDVLTALKVATKFDKADININNKGLFTLNCENDFIKIELYVRGSANV